MSFLRNNFKKGDPVCVVAGARQANRVANILMDLKVIGGRLVRATNADGKGWTLIIDGTSDMPGGPPPGYEPPWQRSGLPDATAQYQVVAADADLAWQADWVRAHA